MFAWKAKDMIEFWYISPININNKRTLISIACMLDKCYPWSLLRNPSYFLSFLGGRFDVRSLLKSEVCMYTTRVMLMITHVAICYVDDDDDDYGKKFKLYFLCLMKCFSAWDECHSTPSCPNLSFLYVLTIYPNQQSNALEKYNQPSIRRVCVNGENCINPLWMTWSIKLHAHYIYHRYQKSSWSHHFCPNKIYLIIMHNDILLYTWEVRTLLANIHHPI